MMEKKISSIFKRARDLIKRKDFQKSLREYEHLEKTTDELSPGVLNKIADLYFQNGDLDLAMDKYFKSIDAYAKENLINNAIAVCKKVIRLFPENYGIYRKMGELYKSQGISSDAVANLKMYVDYAKAGEDPSDVVAVYHSILELDPDDVDLRLDLADYLGRNDRESEAIEQYRSVYASCHEKGDRVRISKLEEKIAALGLEPARILQGTEEEKGEEEQLYENKEVSSEGEEEAEGGDIGTGFHEVTVGRKSEILYPTDLEEVLGIEEEKPRSEEEKAKQPTLEFQSPVSFGEDEVEEISEDVVEDEGKTGGEGMPGTGPRTGGIFVIEEEGLLNIQEIDGDLTRETGKNGEPVVEKSGKEKRFDTVEIILDDFKKGVSESIPEEDFKSHFDLGVSYMTMKLWDDAMKEFLLTMKSPKYLLSSIELIGKCFREKGDIEKARRYLEKGVDIPGYDREDYIDLHYELGVMYLNNDQIEKAYDQLKTVYNLDSKFKNIQGLMEKLQSLKGDGNED